MAARFIVPKSAALSAAVATLVSKIAPTSTVEQVEGDQFATVLPGAPAPIVGLQTMFEILRSADASNALLGVDARDRAHINQWVGVAYDVAVGAMEIAEAEALLPMGAKFVAGTQELTVADLLLYVAVNGAVGSEKTSPKLAKWASGVAKEALVEPFIVRAEAASPTSDNAADGADSKQPKYAKPNEAEIAARRAAKEKEKAEKEKAKAAAPPAAAPAATAAPALSSNELDIRVGLITSIDKHPKAERLFVEKIDLGEPSGPRQIVSGLVQYYSAEELNGRLVLVVANMKPKPLLGIESHGMVLCASSETPAAKEGEAPTVKLELVQVPAGTTPGERVSIGGKLAAEPPGVSKKIAELLALLRTDEHGQVKWGDEVLSVTKGPIVSTITSAVVK